MWVCVWFVDLKNKNYLITYVCEAAACRWDRARLTKGFRELISSRKKEWTEKQIDWHNPYVSVGNFYLNILSITKIVN